MVDCSKSVLVGASLALELCRRDSLDIKLSSPPQNTSVPNILLWCPPTGYQKYAKCVDFLTHFFRVPGFRKSPTWHPHPLYAVVKANSLHSLARHSLKYFIGFTGFTNQSLKYLPYISRMAADLDLGISHHWSWRSPYSGIRRRVACWKGTIKGLSPSSEMI